MFRGFILHVHGDGGPLLLDVLLGRFHERPGAYESPVCSLGAAMVIEDGVVGEGQSERLVSQYQEGPDPFLYPCESTPAALVRHAVTPLVMSVSPQPRNRNQKGSGIAGSS